MQGQLVDSIAPGSVQTGRSVGCGVGVGPGKVCCWVSLTDAVWVGVVQRRAGFGWSKLSVSHLCLEGHSFVPSGFAIAVSMTCLGRNLSCLSYQDGAQSLLPS
jgi:hypothetical protein